MIKFLNERVDERIIVFVNTSIYMKKWLIDEIIKTINSYLCINPMILVEYTDKAMVHDFKKGSRVLNYDANTRLYQPSPFEQLQNLDGPIKLINVTTSLFNNHFGDSDFDKINKYVEMSNVTEMTTLISRCGSEIIEPVLIDKGTIVYDNPENILSVFKRTLIKYNTMTIGGNRYFVINGRCVTYNKIDDFAINPLLKRIVRMFKNGSVDKKFIERHDRYDVSNLVDLIPENLPYIIIMFYYLYSGDIDDKEIEVSYNVRDIYNFIRDNPHSNVTLEEVNLDDLIAGENSIEKAVVVAKTSRFNIEEFKQMMLDEIRNNVIPLYKSDIFRDVIKLKLPEDEIKKCVNSIGMNVNDIKNIRKLVVDSMRIEHDKMSLYKILQRYYSKVLNAMQLVYNIRTKTIPHRSIKYVSRFFQFYGLKTTQDITMFMFGGNMYSIMKSTLNKLIIYNVLYYKNVGGEHDVKFKYI